MRAAFHFICSTLITVLFFVVVDLIYFGVFPHKTGEGTNIYDDRSSFSLQKVLGVIQDRTVEVSRVSDRWFNLLSVQHVWVTHLKKWVNVAVFNWKCN